MFLVNGFSVDGEAGLVQLLGLAQREVFRSIAEVSERSPGDLRGGQLRVLSMLPLEGTRRLTDLATIADMTKQAMGEYVAELASSGYVTLAPDPSDRRAKLVSLTPAGRRASDFARETLARVDDLWRARLSGPDLDTLKGLLARVSGIG